MAEGLPPLIAKLVADLSGYSAKLNEAVVQAKDADGKTSSSFSKVGAIARKALVGARGGPARPTGSDLSPAGQVRTFGSGP